MRTDSPYAVQSPPNICRPATQHVYSRKDLEHTVLEQLAGWATFILDPLQCSHRGHAQRDGSGAEAVL